MLSLILSRVLCVVAHEPIMYSHIRVPFLLRPPLLRSSPPPLLSVSGRQVGTADGPQWSLGGDTWVVGCAIPDTAVFPQFTELNPDMKDPR